MTAEKLMALPDYRTSAALTEVEKLAIELADHMAKARPDVPQELFDRLRQHFDEAQLVELASAIAWEYYRARVNRVFEIESDDFSEGAFCALPARPALKDG